jgi:hypothetical protein
MIPAIMEYVRKNFEQDPQFSAELVSSFVNANGTCPFRYYSNTSRGTNDRNS